MDDWLINRTLDSIQIRDMGAEEVESSPPSLVPLPPPLEEDNAVPVECDSMDEVHASAEIYKRKALLKEDSSLELPYIPLTGESPLYLGSLVDGTICLSDYRLYSSVNPLFNIPLGLIEQVECRDICNLIIYCKDARTFRCSFVDGATCQRWLGLIQQELSPKRTLDSYFAFVFYSWSRDEQKELFQQLNQKNGKDFAGIDGCSDIPQIYAEVERMGFCRKQWRITEVNINHTLCPSYPQRFIVPLSVKDDLLKLAATFRYSLRIPAVVWRYKKNGSVIARCSQPKVGWFGAHSKEDEMLIQSIVEACFHNPGTEQSAQPPVEEMTSLQIGVEERYSLLTSRNYLTHKVLVIDARSYTAAVANRAKGGGSENTNYGNCEVLYQGLPNIHSIRKAFHSLRLLCASPPDPAIWLSSIESTGWLQYIGSLINTAQLIVNAVDTEQRTVLVHCSDGWDRTPQIVALAELMLDPYYRSKKGFQVLVEREWLDFGHKFADRCGNGIGSEDLNERSPVFLQWLDCVYQLLSEFPCHFEFNEQYLVKLVYHTYSCLFGTFLCNTDKERKKDAVQMRSFSVWSHLSENPVFHNNLYNDSPAVLRLPAHAYKIKFWSEVYFPSTFLSPGILPTQPSQEILVEEYNEESTALVKAKSCDDLTSLGHASGRQRRASDPNAVDVELACFGEKLKEKEPALCLDTESTECVNGTGCKSPPQRTSEEYPADKSEVREEPTYLVPVDPVNEPISVGDDKIGYSDIKCEYVPGVMASADSASESEGSTAESASEKMDYADPLLPKKIIEFLLEEKNSGSCSRSSASPHSRTPSSGFPGSPCDEPVTISVPKEYTVPRHVFDIDGSVIAYNEIQTQVQKLVHELKGEVKKLQKEVSSLIEFKNKIYEIIKFKNGLGAKDGVAHPANTSVLSEVQNSSDEGFVKVDMPKIVLWVPDHLALTCTRCRTPFSTINRKHHCRRCGLVFCSACTPYKAVLPLQQLYHPVRVCEICHSQIEPKGCYFVESCDKLSKPVITAASN